MCVEALDLHMTKNDKGNQNYYLPLDGWVFWFDINDNLWKCTTHDDYIMAIEDPLSKISVMSATSITQLLDFLCKDDNVN